MKKLLYPVVFCSLAEIHGFDQTSFEMPPPSVKKIDPEKIKMFQQFQRNPSVNASPNNTYTSQTQRPTYNRRRLPTRRPAELSKVDNASTATQAPAVDPFSAIPKISIERDGNFYNETKDLFIKVDRACNFKGNVKFLIPSTNETDIVAKANGRPVIVINASDGRIGFRSFFNSVTIVFSNGQKNVCLSNYFSDEILLKALKEENLGNSSGWTLGGRVDNYFSIVDWRQKWGNRTVILLINYDGKCFIAEPS
jgi:hypothetical protein